MHKSRNMRRIKSLREHLLKEKGVKLQRKNGTRLSDDENRDEGLYNELKVHHTKKNVDTTSWMA